MLNFESITIRAIYLFKRLLFAGGIGALVAAWWGNGCYIEGTFATSKKNEAASADTSVVAPAVRPRPEGLVMSAHDMLGRAAMTAANIIITEAGKDGSVEYGIDIYQYKDEDEFYLTTITRGKTPTPKSNVLGSVTIRNNISTFENGEDYRHVAHVHSHPANTNFAYAEKFSLEDYHEACNVFYVGKNRNGEEMYAGPITLYLVVAAPRFLHTYPTLMRFTPHERLRDINTLRGKYLSAHKKFIADNGLLSKTNIVGMGAIDSYSDKNWVIIDSGNRWATVNNRKVDMI